MGKTMIPNKIIVSLLFLLFFMNIPSQAANKTIVFLGDSLTAGPYPYFIQQKIEQAGLLWNVVNAGVPGDTTSGGLKRLEIIVQSSPTAVFIELGINDGWSGVKLTETHDNLERMLLALKEKKILTILAGIQPVKAFNYTPAYKRQFEAIYPALANKYKVNFYPIFLDGVAEIPVMNNPDRVHPNDRGHQILAQKIYDFLAPIVTKINP